MVVDTTRSPFYSWLDHAAIRDVLRAALTLPAGERLVLMKGLIPGLVDDIGVDAVDAFLDELRVKTHRYAEALAHPGEGGATRQVSGEPLGGPIPAGEAHLAGSRNPRRPGGRALERRWEASFWDEIGGMTAAGERSAE